MAATNRLILLRMLKLSIYFNIFQLTAHELQISHSSTLENEAGLNGRNQ